MDNILQVRQIEKKFTKKTALDKVDLHINVGKAYGLLGPNGAGKSTLINIIAGILVPDEGDVTINGFSIKKQRKLAQQFIGVVPQEIALYPSMSAEENLRFFGKLYGLKGKKLIDAVTDNLQLVGLYERRKEEILSYSGGMKRRINIAAALLHQPKLIIMDEPTVGIDPQSRSHILETVKKLQQEKGMSILYTSHYMEEIEVICDRIGIIDNGRIVADGTIRELKQQFADKTQLKVIFKNPIECSEKITTLKEKLKCQIKQQDGSMVVYTNNPHEALPSLIIAINKIKCDIQSIDIIEPNLESIFLSLTGKSLRDE